MKFSQQVDMNLDHLIGRFLTGGPESFPHIALSPITASHIIRYVSMANFDGNNIFKESRYVEFKYSSRILGMTNKGMNISND